MLRERSITKTTRCASTGVPKKRGTPRVPPPVPCSCPAPAGALGTRGMVPMSTLGPGPEFAAGTTGDCSTRTVTMSGPRPFRDGPGESSKRSRKGAFTTTRVSSGLFSRCVCFPIRKKPSSTGTCSVSETSRAHQTARGELPGALRGSAIGFLRIWSAAIRFVSGETVGVVLTTMTGSSDARLPRAFFFAHGGQGGGRYPEALARSRGLSQRRNADSPAVEGLLAAGEQDLAVQHAARGEQFLAQVTHLFRRTAQHRDFQAVTLAEMNVHCGYDKSVVMVLLVDELRGQLAGVVVVDQRDDDHLLALGLLRFLANQPRPDQVADGLAAVVVALRRDERIERIEQRALQRNADPRQ